MRAKSHLVFACAAVFTSFAIIGGQGALEAATSDVLVRSSASRTDIPPSITIGNVSVGLLLDAWGSPMARFEKKAKQVQAALPAWLESGGKESRVAPLRADVEKYASMRDFAKAEQALDGILAVIGKGQTAQIQAAMKPASAKEAKSFSVSAGEVDASGIEDYLGWAVVEPVEGQWNWDVYRENARAIRSSGYRYIPYVWPQNLPKWVRGNPSYGFSQCLDHGRSTESLSVFHPKTRKVYDRLFKQLKAELGDQIDILRVSSPSGFGELHYPALVSDWAFPMEHIHDGFWVNEPEARENFQQRMQAKYKSVEALNSAWGTRYGSIDELEYPRDSSNPRHWLDFVEWYHTAFTAEMGALLDIVRKHFPNTPIAVNIGFPHEKITLGQDLSGIVKMLAPKGIYLRSPTGPAVPFLYTKRVASAYRHYGGAALASEPADGTAGRAETALSLFKDLTTGVTWHFDYAPNLQRAQETLKQVQDIPSGGYPEVDAAIFFPTTYHRLSNWNKWREKGFAGGYPGELMPFAEQIRDLIDYDVVDEAMIRDGALARYRVLLWPVGDIAEAETMQSIADWVQAGGTLAVKDAASLRDVAGRPGAIAQAVRAAKRRAATVPMGAGYVIDAGGEFERLMHVIARRGNPRQLGPDYPRQITSVRPIDTERDQVLVSIFSDGVLLFNRGERPVKKRLSVPPGSWSTSLPGIPETVHLEPLEIRWIKSGANP